MNKIINSLKTCINIIKLHFILFLIISSSIAGFGQRGATTEKGEKIIIFENGTWKYTKDSPTKQKTFNKDSAVNKTKDDSLKKTELKTENESKKELPKITQNETSGLSSTILIIIISVFLLVIGGILFYFLLFRRWQNEKKIKSAFDIINSDNKENFLRAKEILVKANLSDLNKNILNDVYFALAYLEAKNEKFDDAYHELLKIEKPDQSEYLYFLIWLGVKLKKHKEVFELFKENEKKIANYLNSKDLTALACLCLGKECWKNGELTEGIIYFEFITNKLKVLADKVPSTFSDQFIIQGIKELYNDSEKARRYFQDAKKKAEEEKKPTFYSEIGLLICDFKEAENLETDDELTEELIKENQLKEYINIDNQLSTFIKSKEALSFINLYSGKKGTNEFTVICNLFLWHVVSGIFTWFNLKEKGGLPDTEKKQLFARLERILSIDPEMSDPKLIKGLILYFFFNDQQKGEALKLLAETNTNLPEINSITTKENKISKLNEKSLDNYLIVVKKYIQDKTVPLKFREQMKEYLQKFERFEKVPSTITIEESEEDIIATVQDIQNRSKLISKKIETLIKPKLAEKDSKQLEEFNSLLENIEKISTILNESTNELEKTEQKVMLNAGEFLLNEEVTNQINTSKKENFVEFKPVKLLKPNLLNPKSDE